MRLVLFNRVKCHIDFKKIVFNMVMIGICLASLGVGERDVNALRVSNPLKIIEVYKNQQSTKYKLTVSKDIKRITDAAGVLITPERLSGKSVLFENGGITQIRVYSNQEEYILVNLDSANIKKDTTPPNILWKYKNIDENVIYMELEDAAGLYEIKNINHAESLRTILTKMPKNVIVSFDASDIKNEIKIYDVFGNVSLLNINDITLNVSIATKNMNGDNVALKLENSDYIIKDVTYTDGTEIETVSKYKLEKMYNVSEGTTKVVVNYGDEYTVIPLVTDLKAPEVIRAWKREDGSKIFIETKDGQSGIGKVTFYNSENENEEVFKTVSGLKTTCIASGDVLDGATHLYVYDGVGNKLKLNMSSIQTDTERPTVTIKYEDGKYIVTVKESNSGIAKVKFDDREVDTFENCPTDDIVYKLDSVDDITYICAYNGVGNATLVSINSEISSCGRMYKNNKGTLISITVEDLRGIVKITDQDGRTIERLFGNETRVSGVYKVRGNIQSIKVFYEEDKSYDIYLEELTQPPQVTHEIVDNGFITHCTVASNAGIKSIEYSNGKKILFKTDMPDDIEVDCILENDNGGTEPAYVTVYDALGNSIEINETLA